MKRKLLYGLFFVAMFLLLSAAVMFLWNTLLPSVLKVSAINYRQAVGLMVLCRILFGGFNFPLRKLRGEEPDHLLKDKLMGMDESARSTFKEEWRKRCAQKDA